MKILVIVMSLALATTSAMAHAPEVKAIRRDAAHIYQLGIKHQVQRLKKSVDAPCFSSAF